MSALPSIEQLRRHIAELCVEHALTPLPSAGESLASPVGPPAVELAYVGGPRGYWRCLHRIGAAIWDPEHDGIDRQAFARAWAESVALAVPPPVALDLIDATLDLGGVGSALEAHQTIVAAG